MPKKQKTEQEKIQAYEAFVKAWNNNPELKKLNINPWIFSDMRRFYIYDRQTATVSRPFYSSRMASKYDENTNPFPHMSQMLNLFNAEFLTGKNIECYIFAPGEKESAAVNQNDKTVYKSRRLPIKLNITQRNGKITIRPERVSTKTDQLSVKFVNNAASQNIQNIDNELALHQTEEVLQTARNVLTRTKDELTKENAAAKIYDYLRDFKIPKMDGSGFSSEDMRQLAPALVYYEFLLNHPDIRLEDSATSPLRNIFHVQNNPKAGYNDVTISVLAHIETIYINAIHHMARRRDLLDKDLPPKNIENTRMESILDYTFAQLLCKGFDGNEKNNVFFQNSREISELRDPGRANALREALKNDHQYWSLIKQSSTATFGQRMLPASARAVEVYRGLRKSLQQADAQKNAAADSKTSKGKELQGQTLTKTQRKGQGYMNIAQSALGRNIETQEAFSDLQQKMNTLNSILTPLTTINKAGQYPILKAADAENLKKAYEDAQKACETVKERSRNNRGLRQSMDKISEILKKDLVRIEKFKEGEQLTLPFLLRATAINAIDLDKMEHGPVLMHGQMSQRMAMQLEVTYGNQKRAIPGLFTQESTHKDEEAATKAYYEAHPEFKELREKFDEFLAPYHLNSASLLQHIVIQNTDNGPYFGMNTGDPFYKDEELKKWLGSNLNIMRDNTVQANEAAYRFFSGLKEVIRTSRTEEKAGIANGSRLDFRNCAVYEVASLLGLSDRIARAENTIIKKDGKYISGTFMAFAKGEDAVNLTKGNHFGNVTDEDINRNTTLIKQTSDLQVIDFICGNVDRHGGNIFYQFDKNGKINGIQGIDNDMSFGIVPGNMLTGEKGSVNFTGISAMRFINKETSEKLMSLTPETLTLTLKRFKFTNDEINAAANRLQMLKDALDDRYIRENPEPFVPKEFKSAAEKNKTKVFVLDDNQVRRLKMQSVMPAREMIDKNGHYVKDGQNTFEKVTLAIHNASRRMNTLTGEKLSKKDAILARQTAAELEKNITKNNLPAASDAVYFDPKKTEEKLNKKLQALKDGKGFSPSIEYKNILEYAELITSRLKKMTAKDDNSYKLTCTMLENLDNLCTIYLDKKREEGVLDNNAATNHVFAVQDLQHMIKNASAKLGETDSECYRRLSETERQGAFSYKQDSRTIANQISALKKAETPDAFIERNNKMTLFFDGVAKTHYAAALENYAKQVDLLANCEGISRNLKDALTVFSSQIKTNIQIKDGKKIADASSMENVKKGFDKLLQNPTLQKAENQRFNCGLQYINNRLLSGHLTMPPADELIAVRLTVCIAKDPQRQNCTKDYLSFKKMVNELQGSLQIAQMIRGLKGSKLEELTLSSEEKLHQKFKEANSKKEASKKKTEPVKTGRKVHLA